MINRSKQAVYLAALFLSTSAFAGESRTILDPEASLQIIRSRMAAHLQQLSHYTCHVVVTRMTRFMNNTGLNHDRIELDVAFVDGKELFSRPGDARFDDRSISDIVPPGMISNDAFGSHDDDVISGGLASFKYVGLCKKDGHSALRYNFEVLQENSQLAVRRGSAGAVVGYKGSLWVDAATLDILRLQWKTDHIPRSIGITSVEKSVRYEPQRIGTSDFLLAIHSELASFDELGTYRLNAVSLDRCKEFRGESVVEYCAPAEGRADCAGANRETFEPHRVPSK